MKEVLKQILTIVIFAVIVSAVLVGLRGTAAKSAYDAASAKAVTDSSGFIHNISAGPIDGDTSVLMYTLAIGLVWLVAGVAIVMTAMKGLKSK